MSIPKPTRGELLVVFFTTVAAIAASSVFRLAGIEFELKDSASMDQVRAIDVAISAVFAGIAAWGVYRFMESRGWQRMWPFAGSAALAVSMIGPAYLADGADAGALMALHFIVAIGLIVGFNRTGIARRQESEQPRSPRRVAAPRPR